MRVTVSHNVDIECEVDVSIEDVILELNTMADRDDVVRRKVSAIDSASKVIATIGFAPLAEMKSVPLATAFMLRERLLPIVLWCEERILKGET